MWVRIPAGTDISDSIVDCFLTIFPEFSIKTYINSEISSSMENQVCEYLSFGGVSVGLISDTVIQDQETLIFVTGGINSGHLDTVEIFGQRRNSMDFR